MTTELIQHLETYCGALERARDTDPEGKQLPFQIAQFAGGPFRGAKTLSTIGLSNLALEAKGTLPGAVRQELIMLYRVEHGMRELPVLLQQVALEYARSRQALLRGTVIGPRGTLISGYPFVSFYTAAPVYFPEEFAKCMTRSGPVFLAWLVPITADETELIQTKGWSAFEDELEKVNPDLIDLDRVSIVSPDASRSR